MTVTFPEIQPTAHDFVFPKWPTTEKRSESGVRSVRRWGNRPSDAQMTLLFDNKTQSEIALIYAAHRAAQGPVNDVKFPPVVFKNVTDAQALLMLFPTESGLRWYFLGEPQGSRSQGGKRMSVRVEFRAELRMG